MCLYGGGRDESEGRVIPPEKQKMCTGHDGTLGTLQAHCHTSTAEHANLDFYSIRSPLNGFTPSWSCLCSLTPAAGHWHTVPFTLCHWECRPTFPWLWFAAHLGFLLLWFLLGGCQPAQGFFSPALTIVLILYSFVSLYLKMKIYPHGLIKCIKEYCIVLNLI